MTPPRLPPTYPATPCSNNETGPDSRVEYTTPRADGNGTLHAKTPDHKRAAYSKFPGTPYGCGG